MKKIILALMLCLALVMTVLTSCGGDEQKPVGENAVETNAETTPENESEKTPEAESNEEKAEDNNVEEKTEEPEKEPVEETAEEPVEEPELAEDVAVDPEKAEEVVNTLEFENVNLLSGIANAMGKATAEVTQEDIEAISYLGISLEATGDYTVYIGMQDYIDAYNQGPDAAQLEQLLKKSVVEVTPETDIMGDISRFKNLHTFELYDFKISDISFIKELENLAFGYFRNNGITDVSVLEGYDSDALRELDFTDNNIVDWTPLHHIKEKVIVSYKVQEMVDASGETVVVPMMLTLEDMIAQDEAKVSAETESSSQGGFVDENNNPVDFSSLFE